MSKPNANYVTKLNEISTIADQMKTLTDNLRAEYFEQHEKKSTKKAAPLKVKKDQIDGVMLNNNNNAQSKIAELLQHDLEVAEQDLSALIASFELDKSNAERYFLAETS
jgi:hypothetical protein